MSLPRIKHAVDILPLNKQQQIQRNPPKMVAIVSSISWSFSNLPLPSDLLSQLHRLADQHHQEPYVATTRLYFCEAYRGKNTRTQQMSLRLGEKFITPFTNEAIIVHWTTNNSQQSVLITEVDAVFFHWDILVIFCCNILVTETFRSSVSQFYQNSP